MAELLTVNDQARSYKTTLSSPFDNEVKSAKATAFHAELTPSTNVPEAGESYMLRKTTGGSGTKAGSEKIRELLKPENSSEKHLYTTGIIFSFTETGDVTHLGDMIMAQATKLTANGCALLKDICNGVHKSE